MNKIELQELLLDEFDMQAYYMDETIKQVENLTDRIKEAFFSFLQTKKIPDIEVGKYSCKSLVENHKLTGIGALFFLDWLEKDEEVAEFFLMFV